MVAHPNAFNLVAREYAASALEAGDGPAAAERLRELYRRTPSMDLLDAIALLDPAPAHQRERLLAHLREHPTMRPPKALLGGGPGAARQPDARFSANRDPDALGDAIGRAAQPLHRYRCAACGFEAKHYFWQCPGCLDWDSYPPQRLEDL